MVTAITTQTALPTKRVEMARTEPRFGNGTTAAAKKGTEIAHIKVAKFLSDTLGFSRIRGDARIGGLSLEDMAGRLLTLVGIYIPQGIYAVKDNKHPWETNGRNAVVWLMTLALQTLSKSENFGVNTLFLNPLMKQKGSAVSKFPMIQKFIDPIRMDVDYLDIIQKAGIKLKDEEKQGALAGKKALWASSWLDANKVEKIENYMRELAAKGSKLTPEEVAMKKAIPQFFKRINAFNLASTAMIMAATIYFIGGVAMRIVNRIFTPLDGEQKLKKEGHPQPFQPGYMLMQRPPYSPPGMPVQRPPHGMVNRAGGLN